jgi:hypothetical protein
MMIHSIVFAQKEDRPELQGGPKSREESGLE